MAVYTIYSSEEERQTMQTAGAGSFEAIWNLQAECFETPNKRRNGWSSVIRWPEEEPCWFIKRQENHNTRTLFHPFSGIPTYRRELKNVIALQRAGIKVIDISFYGERVTDKAHQAILVTRALTGYQDLYTFYKNNLNNESLIIAVMAETGKVIRYMHKKGWFHYCLYPNHIFVKADSADPINICLIDLEKARRRIPLTGERLKELKCFIRHASHTFSAEHLQYLIKSYCEQTSGIWFSAKKIQNILFALLN